MRVTFNPAVASTVPIKPVQRVIRRNATLSGDPIEKEMETIRYSVKSQLSDIGLKKAKEEIAEEKTYKKNPIWNAMINI